MVVGKTTTMASANAKPTTRAGAPKQNATMKSNQPTVARGAAKKGTMQSKQAGATNNKTKQQTKAGGKTKPSQPPAPPASKQAKATENEPDSKRPKEATHLVRVNVLGLAGITVDRKKCRDVGKKKEYPAPPKNMRAVVAFSRGPHIRGTTILSKPLTRSPNDDIVLSGSMAEQDDLSAEKNRKRHEEADLNKLQRHVAVWAAEDDMSLGSPVTFEATLRKLDQGNSTLTSTSTYAPKSFELTIALTEDSPTENKVALPFGVANLNISGDESPNGETLVLDVPILSLMQARPLASNKNGLGGYQMIAIRPKNKGTDTSSVPEPPRTKKRGLKRLFSKKTSTDNKNPKVPTISERKAFTEAYTPDPTGDAILRIQLQVIEKGARARRAAGLDSLASSSVGTSMETGESTVATNDIVGMGGTMACGLDRSKDTVDGEDVDDDDDDDDDDDESNSCTESTVTEHAGSLPTASYSDDDGSTTDSGTLVTSDSQTFQTASLDEGSKGADGSTIQDEYTLSFDPNKDKEKGPVHDVDNDLNIGFVNVFGRKIRIPRCGPLAMSSDGDGPRGRYFNDEMTHVTADFFGRDIPIPICSAIKPRDDDDTVTIKYNDSFSTMSEQNSLKNDKNNVLKDYLKSKPHYEVAESLLQAGKVEMDDQQSDEDTFDENGSMDDGTFDGTFDGTLEESLEESDAGTQGDSRMSSSQKVGSIQQNPIESKSKGSPKGVAEIDNDGFVQQNEVEFPSKQAQPTSISQRFVDMFRCGPNTVDDHVFPFRAEVPGMVVQEDLDSIGELTASTYEMKINKRRFEEHFRPAKEMRNNLQATLTKSLPVAFGGQGLCASNDADFETRNKSTRIGGKSNENYFSEYEEYDDYSYQVDSRISSAKSGKSKKNQGSTPTLNPNQVTPRRSRTSESEYTGSGSDWAAGPRWA